jgi:hypothetical protein
MKVGHILKHLERFFKVPLQIKSADAAFRIVFAT